MIAFLSILPLAVPLAYLIGRYRRTSEIAELRRTLRDRTERKGRAA